LPSSRRHRAVIAVAEAKFRQIPRWSSKEAPGENQRRKSLLGRKAETPSRSPQKRVNKKQNPLGFFPHRDEPQINPLLSLIMVFARMERKRKTVSSLKKRD